MSTTTKSIMKYPIYRRLLIILLFVQVVVAAYGQCEPPNVSLISGPSFFYSGQSATVTIQSDGNYVLFKKWLVSQLINGSWTSFAPPVSGAGANPLEFIVSVPTRFQAQVLSDGCGLMLSDYIEIGELPLPTIGAVAVSAGQTTPTGQVVCPGQVFSLSVSGGNAVQWYKRDDQHPYGGAISPTLSISRPTYFKAVMYVDGYGQIETPEFLVDLYPVSVGNFSVSSSSICPNSPLTLSVTSYVGTRVSWQKSENGGASWTAVAETTATSYVYNNQSSNALWRAVALNICDVASAPTTSLSVTMIVPFGGDVTPVSSTICIGSGTTLTLNNKTGTVIRWESSTNGGSWQYINYTGTSYPVVNLQASTSYRAIVGNCSSEAPSLVASIAVQSPQPGYLSLISGTTAFCAGENAVGTLQLNDPSGLFKRWVKKEFISGSWTPSWATVATTGTTFDYAVNIPTRFSTEVQTEVCGLAYSPYVEVYQIPATITGAVNISTGQPLVCSGQTFSLSVSGMTPGATVLGWYKRDADHGYAGAISPSNTSIGKPTYFKAVVSNGNCNLRETPEFFVDLVPVSIGALSVSQSMICPNSPLTLSVPSYQGTKIRWQKSEDAGTTWTIVGETSGTSFVYNNQVNNTRWQAVAVNSCDATFPSNKVDVGINTPQDLTLSPSLSTKKICSTCSQIISVPLASGASYQWYKNNIPISGANQNSFNATQAATYKVQGTSSASCISTSSLLQIQINIPPTVSAGSNQVITLPVNSVVLTGSASDADGSIQSYAWSKISGEGAVLSGAATSTLSVSELQAGSYSFRLTAADDFEMAFAEVNVQVNYPPNNYNYVRESIIQVSGQTPETVATLTADQKSVTTTYFDGLGRPQQTVTTQGSPLRKDVVQPIVYDALGRETIKYLPYVDPGVDGFFKTSPLVNGNSYTNSLHYNFYHNSNDGVADDDNPFAISEFEASPLDRPLKQFGAGQNWKDNNKAISHQYLNNQASEVLLFAYDANTGLVSRPNGTGAYYAAGQLTVNKTIDEQGNEVIEYTDKAGHTVCKKVQSDTISGGKQYASTYYLYDDFGNLVMVLPPEAVNKFVQQ
jgi:hypothetical protein